MQIGSRSPGGLVKITVATGGTGYTTPPTITITGGGGTGATAYAHMAGTAVESVFVSARGTGFTQAPTISFSGGGGTGAGATAAVYAGSARPMSFFKGRYNDMYGVDGMGRGIRWNGTDASAEPLGLSKSRRGPTIVQSAATNQGFVSAIQIVNSGSGYASAPDVTFSGGSPSTAAKARATLADGRVASITITDNGANYTATPSVTLTGGVGSGATLGVGVMGSVFGVTVIAGGSGYVFAATTSPSITFSSAQGLTSANANVVVDSLGKVSGVNILSGGTGATGAVTATISGGGGAGAVVAVQMSYRVTSVTAVGGGTGYMAAPVITFRAATDDTSGSGAAATAVINGSGSVTGATVYSGGDYAKPPTATIEDTSAKAVATLERPMSGKYQCCIRYLDDTPESENGPVPSAISDLTEVDIPGSAGTLTWSFDHTGIDDRVSAVELWRTSADQAVILYRVATIQRSDAAFTGTYADSLTDDDLQDTKRSKYGLMPITLPSGQLNARRFGIPPGEFAVACMFQDRAWYAVDTTGLRPNSLLYSEIDEPESVPEENELVVQENTVDHDKIVALIPFGTELLIAQQSHIYKLNYVAQPVIDASIVLGSYRGVLNTSCWATMAGVAFLVDGYGMYAFDGRAEDPVSVPVDNYWRDGIIDFSKSSQFHVRADLGSRTVRFFYCTASDSAPVRALCYCIATKAWWEETYPQAVTAGCPAFVGGRIQEVYGTAAGGISRFDGGTDAGSSIPYAIRTGAMPLSNEGGSRAIGVVYNPTQSDATLNVGLHYNNSGTPRPNAISSDPGGGFVTTAGGTSAQLNMKKTRSALGDSTGFARAYYSGRVDERSSGGDRHMAIAVSGTQAATTAADAVAIYAVSIDGVK
jgi:hypothetical protein